MARTVVVSGGFDPIHRGHVRMFKEARALGDRLVVIINNDNWIRTKKGKEPFYPEDERAEIIGEMRSVDEVVLSEHTEHDEDRSVSRELEKIRPQVFANGGDRRSEEDIPESEVCKRYGIEMVFNIGQGGKIQSSSWLIAKVAQSAVQDPVAEDASKG